MFVAYGIWQHSRSATRMVRRRRCETRYSAERVSPLAVERPARWPDRVQNLSAPRQTASLLQLRRREPALLRLFTGQEWTGG
jgi:hypothetical protein